MTGPFGEPPAAGVPAVPSAAGAPDATDPADVDALAAALRAESDDVEVYARVLTVSLADALPPGMVTVERERSMSDRMAKRPGTVTSLRIDAGDMTLTLARGRSGVPVARVARAVRGVVISSKDVSVQEWVQLLAGALAERARQSATARVALARMIGAR